MTRRRFHLCGMLYVAIGVAAMFVVARCLPVGPMPYFFDQEPTR